MTDETTTAPPARAKKPQDRRPKADPPGTVTVRGKKWQVDVGVVDDFELLEDIGELDRGNPARMPRVLRRLVGDQYDAVLESLRDEETGRVGIDDGVSFTMEVFEALDPN